MGTDIHMIVQAMNEDGEWKTLSEYLDEPRNYNLFSMLAGVRKRPHLPLIAEPRDIPKDLRHYMFMNDACIEVPGKREKWLGDHSFSWLTSEEVQAFASGLEGEAAEGFQYMTELVKEMQAKYPDEQLRFVFGFDN